MSHVVISDFTLVILPILKLHEIHLPYCKTTNCLTMKMSETDTNQLSIGQWDASSLLTCCSKTSVERCEWHMLLLEMHF